MKRLECPTCETQYTFLRCGVTNPSVNDTYTIICSVCSQEYDVTLYKRRFNFFGLRAKYTLR